MPELVLHSNYPYAVEYFLATLDASAPRPQLSATLGIHAGLPPSGAGSRPGSIYGGFPSSSGAGGGSGAAGIDPALLDQLITSLLGVQAANVGSSSHPSAAQVTAGLSRFRPLSRSLRPGSTRRVGSVRGNRGGGGNAPAVVPGVNGDAPASVPAGLPSGLPPGLPPAHGGPSHSGLAGHAALPTIEEGSLGRLAGRNIRRERPMSLTERALNAPAVRAVVQAMQAAPQRLHHAAHGGHAEDPLLESLPPSPRIGRRGSETSTTLM
ncbi:collagen alpha-2(I) chain-like [Frankliniella occidentalis]|uniref:Collagen alpha-2(I) chain-like n=1 Tax=Frankliniella occidentalis TaxID=133901 RepID=A0A9C6X2I9_FRAOC|nr:collagen alpha-2(I) chain-like [Frankliniella occidentalis]